jgi:hypothetical protein
MTELPQGAPVGCPAGNEQGLEVTFSCASVAPPVGGDPVPIFAIMQGYRLERSAAGAFSLIISGVHFREGATVIIGGITPKKLKFKNADPGDPGAFRIIIAKGRVCNGLPGVVIITNLSEISSPPFFCNAMCPQ